VTLRNDLLLDMTRKMLIRYFGREKVVILEGISDGCFSNCRSFSEIVYEPVSNLNEAGQ
jgi:hypothetical protein